MAPASKRAVNFFMFWFLLFDKVFIEPRPGRVPS